MRTITIDCAGVRTPDELWQRYLDAAQPDEAQLFGCNLDAFWDAIEAAGPGWPGNVDLVFVHSDALENLRTANGGSFRAALEKIAVEATRLRIRLT